MRFAIPLLIFFFAVSSSAAADDAKGTAFFERHIRPLLIKHCYECHSEKAGEQQGGLLLDRKSGWIKGGDTQKAVVPGDPGASLLIKAVRYTDEDLQMPPEGALAKEDVKLLERWVKLGAPGPAKDLGDTEFSRLGDQDYLFAQAKTHWAFQPVGNVKPPESRNDFWSVQPIDKFVLRGMRNMHLAPSKSTDKRTLIRRLTYDLTGLPPTFQEVEEFVAKISLNERFFREPYLEVEETIDRLLESPAFGEHMARMWLDVARYADTDSFYRPDTKTPHYFPFAFTYRDYVVNSFNADKPFDQFLREQLAADLLGFKEPDPELAALGFLTVGPHANRNPTESLDDWIDTTTRGLMGLSVACARCHDHKYEPIPTADYYSLRGVFASVNRVKPLVEAQLPQIKSYTASEADRADYEKQRAAIDKKIADAGKSKAKGNNRSVAQKIRETELAKLLAFHPGAPVHTMVVREAKRPAEPFIFVRGDPRSRGDSVPRRFLRVLDPKQPAFPADASGRLELAKKIASPDNPLTARVFVNRVWGHLMGSHIVATPSDFGLQAAEPTHPELLDWLAGEFMKNDWSVKWLVRTIVLSRTYQQASDFNAKKAAVDPENKWLWRANRKRLSIEALRDTALAVAGNLDRTPHGRPQPLWGEDYTKRRAIYGFINRFNLDPTLRVFDFPTPMQSQSARDESIVAPQLLFTMNSAFIIDQAAAVTEQERFVSATTDEDKVAALFQAIFQRKPAKPETARVAAFVKKRLEMQAQFKNKNKITSPWRMVAQALMMSNEFQYLD